MKIIDMHCDTISLLYDQKNININANLLRNDISIDLEKMKKGNYLLQNFACFVHLGLYDNPVLRVNQLIDYYYQQMDLYKEYIKPVYKFKDILDHEKQGYLSSLLTIEEGGVVYNDLSLLRNYYRLGVRMITLTWNFANGIGYPNVTNAKTFADIKNVNEKDGLTPFGIEYIKEMERLGIIIDVSHLSDAGFYDVLKHTTKPFVASHSNARSVCDVARNMSDDMIIQLAKRGGVMGINFCGDFLKQSDVGNEVSSIDDMVKHIAYIKELAGIDCIGLGSDFDGINSKIEIKDASSMYLLEERLLLNGFSKEEVEKIFYKNVLDLYKAIL